MNLGFLTPEEMALEEMEMVVASEEELAIIEGLDEIEPLDPGEDGFGDPEFDDEDWEEEDEDLDDDLDEKDFDDQFEDDDFDEEWEEDED
jgi:hypothetical protein